MAQLTVRNLDEELVRRLKIRAAERNRSAEAEHRAILELVLRPQTSNFWQEAEKLRASTKDRPHTDSTILVRQDRDRDTT